MIKICQLGTENYSYNQYRTYWRPMSWSWLWNGNYFTFSNECNIWIVTHWDLYLIMHYHFLHYLLLYDNRRLTSCFLCINISPLHIHRLCFLIFMTKHTYAFLYLLSLWFYIGQTIKHYVYSHLYRLLQN